MKYKFAKFMLTFESILRIAILSASLTLVSCNDSNTKTSNKDMTLDEQYPKPWKEPSTEEFVSVGKTLVKNNVTGCGEYYIRPSSQGNGDYLVGCSSDGTNWTYYMVWTYTEKVIGPYNDTLIEKPR